MIKPNIRGVERHLLRFRLKGWQHRAGKYLIKYRYPWRSAWVTRVFQSSELEPRLSRSGNVYLVENSKHTEDGIKQPKRFIRIVGGLILVIALVLALNLALDNSKRNSSREKSSSGSKSALGINTESSCSEILLNPGPQFEKWLDGQLLPRIVIEELDEKLLGGFQHRTVKIRCENLASTFRLTLSKHQQELVLKNFARLDN